MIFTIDASVGGDSRSRLVRARRVPGVDRFRFDDGLERRALVHRRALVGRVGGLAATGVDDNDLSASLADLANPPAHSRSRHQTAVGDQRVRTEHEVVIGPLEIRDRPREL